jgi:AraC-like DNA-binding protein
MFDDLEYISIKNQTTSFPRHFHETFCISLIFSGVEKIEFEAQDLYSESGSISITNPFEVHSNPLVDKDVLTSFDTIYIPAALMKFYARENIMFSNRTIQDINAIQQFLVLKNALDGKIQNDIHRSLGQFITTIKPYSQQKHEGYKTVDFEEFHELDAHIEHNILEKFELEELSRIANTNKYGFIKKFKLFTGMSPMNYIIMRKIFSSKNRIAPSTNLSELAYQYNFTDIAHFSKTFKRYVGISPSIYQRKMINRN